MMMKMMKTNIFNTPGQLFLGSDLAAAKAQGPRHFRTSGNAVRFAMEQAAPVHLRGALLKVDGQSFGPAQIAKLHQDLLIAGKKIRGL
jgi:hypothetical protein